MRSGGLLLAVFVAAGCSVPGSRSGRVDSTGPAPIHVPAVGERHEFGPVEAMRPGQWARYRVARDGAEQEVTLGVVARDGPRVWLEVVEEADPRRASLRLIDSRGRIEKAFYRELPAGAAPSAVMPQAVVQAAAPAPEAAPQDVTKQAGRETIGARSLPVTIETALYRDEELGREYREEHVWSPEVPPLFDGGEHGGLVRRITPRLRAQLLDFGDGYTALTPPPGP